MHTLSLGRRLAVLGFLALVSVSAAQQSIAGQLVATPPKIDGIIDAAEWSSIPGGTGGFNQRTTEPQAPERFQFWLAYDREYIYFAARIRPLNPKALRANEFRTNVSLDSDERVFLSLDPFGANTDFNQFEINPRGATRIGIAGGRAAKAEWLGEFTARARITPEGWEAEARIPWGVMRLPGAGPRDLRFRTGWYETATSQSFLWTNSGNDQVQNNGVWTAVNLPASPPKTLRLLPYAYFGGADREKLILESGLDFRAPLTDQIDFVGSLNPDFRNIENQILSLDFSYFERLAGEARPFFLEGSDFFRTSFDSPIFASQRIRDFDLGSKVYGRLGDLTSIGVLNAIDFNDRSDTVARVNHRLSERTSVTGAFAARDEAELTNRATYLAFNHGWGNYYAFGQRSDTDDSLRGSGYRFNTGGGYFYKGFSYGFEYLEISPEFRPRIGFAPETDVRGWSGSVDLQQDLQRGPLLQTEWSLSFVDKKTFTGDPYRSGGRVSTSTTWRNQLDLDISYRQERFRGETDRIASASLEWPRGDRYRNWEVFATGGEIGGEAYRLVGFGTSYRPWQPLQLGLRSSFRRLGSESEDLQILSATYDIGVDRSISGRVVKRGGDLNGYVSFRRSGTTGAEYFLIVGDPNANTFRTSVILKVLFPLEVRF